MVIYPHGDSVTFQMSFQLQELRGAGFKSDCRNIGGIISLEQGNVNRAAGVL